MAVDKKSDYVGNHGGKYTDEHGQTRQFTYVDHDVKPKISFLPKKTPFNIEWDALEEFVLGHPIFYKFLKDNELEWGQNVNLGHLREIKKLIDEQNIQGDTGRSNY